MKIDPKDLKPLVKSRKSQTRERSPQDSKSETARFEEQCRAAGMNPGTVRRRMAPKHERGQGMTLEEALTTPVKTRSESGTARRKKTSWKTWGKS